MTDILCGQKVKGGDFPPTKFAEDDTVITDISTTSSIAGSPVVSVTFVAPTSGRVFITVGGGQRNNAANADRVSMGWGLYEGTSSAGVLVTGPSAFRSYTGMGLIGAGDYQYGERCYLQEGLTPGTTYYCEHLYVKLGAGGTTGDISSRTILVEPTS